jgi:gas vesicle protein
MTRGQRNLTYLAMALLGGAVGAAIGLLAAPAPGRQTRRRLADEAEGVLERGQDVMQGVADYVQEALGEGRRTLNRVING